MYILKRIIVLLFLLAKIKRVRATKVVLAVIDDLGYNDVGFQGNGEIRTPHLNAMAREGLVFESMYGGTECTPSRAMLLTGRHAVALGLQDSVIHGTEPRGMDETVETLADAFRSIAYSTAAIGKWHLGFYAPRFLPCRRGFDYFFGILVGGGDHYSHETTESFIARGNASKTIAVTGRNLWENDHPYDQGDDEGIHTTELYTAKSLALLKNYNEQNQNDFFLYLSYQAVHGPIQTPSVSYAPARSACHGPFSGDDDEVNWALRPRLCGMVTGIDNSIGQIYNKLQQDNNKDFILWVLSDNGGVKRHGSSNWPLRGEKGEFWEGGVRLVSLVTAPFLFGHNDLVQGRRYRGLTHLSDVGPTLLDLVSTNKKSCTFPKIKDTLLSGISLKHIFENNEQESSLRNALLINRNSDTWGGGGALVFDLSALDQTFSLEEEEDNDDEAVTIQNQQPRLFKLLIENSVGDAVLYRAGRVMLAAQNYDSQSLDAALQIRRDALFPTPLFHLYDLNNDPSEDIDLANSTIHAPILAAALNVWNLLDGRVPSNPQVWQDDGPLAAPSIFADNFWQPWRDDDDLPLATYQLLPSSSVDYADVLLEQQQEDSSS
uniref:Sulfatase N-terminal domain-containing protein n=1 Tax=Aureoumbra lagunensis TaxID=44058 RepID=A0A7S3JYK8_9STRA|mmetsp:Transcript_8464/g.12944  ORF Transcript_8464/g.12944 Transcript_8464/m.12944 type:complete len:603 (-) Transcript_8464:1326-3134(-)